MWSPTNAILTGIALANLMVNIDYIPFTIHHYIQNDTLYSASSSYAWAIITLIHAHISVTFHSISSWLIVLLAVWRYVSVSFPSESKSWCTMLNAQIMMLLTYILTPLISIPLYLSFSVHENVIVSENHGNFTTHQVGLSHLSNRSDGLLKNINFWVYSVVMKLVPCILLTYLSLALIRVVVRADKRRQRLRANQNHNVPLNTSVNSLSTDVTSGGPAVIPSTNLRSNDQRNTGLEVKQDPKMLMVLSNTSTPSCSTLSLARKASIKNHVKTVTASSSQSNRTTKMLLAILLFFLVSELPTGIVYLLIGLLGDEFRDSVYQPLGDIFDILALVNASINFILLATMSRLFRKTFCKIFWPKRYRERLSFKKDSHKKKNERPIIINRSGNASLVDGKTPSNHLSRNV